MSKIKICLAVSNKNAENFLMENIVKRDPSVLFTEPALHREAVIDRVTYDMPSVLVISESLPEGGSTISFDAVITTIRTKFTGCRIVLLAGDHGAGDPFLSKMVSRGVYDIVVGLSVNLYDVVDCIFEPKDYSYAEKLQGLEITPQNEEEKGAVSLVKVLDEEKTGGLSPKQEVTDTRIEILEPDYGTSILKAPAPSGEEDISFDTSILTTPEIPEGILFERVLKPSQTEPEKSTETDTNPYIVSESHILKGERKQEEVNPIIPANRFLPKIVLFFGARQGVGCTTSLINTAFTLARQGKRVAVIDAVWNDKALFDKLRLMHSDTGFNNSKNKPLPKGFVSSYTVNVQKKNVCGSIQFLELMTSDEMPEGLLSMIRALSTYNYILIDMSISHFDKFSAGLVNLSDSKVAVVTQDSYEFMNLKNYLYAYAKHTDIYKNLSILITKGEERVTPVKADASKYFEISRDSIYMIPCDNTGFINASTRDGVYINSGKNRIVRKFREFAGSLE